MGPNDLLSAIWDVTANYINKEVKERNIDGCFICEATAIRNTRGRPGDKNIIRNEIETKTIEHLKIFHTTLYIN